MNIHINYIFLLYFYLKLIVGEIIESHPHEHPPEHGNIETRKYVNNLKKNSIKSNDTPHVIITNCKKSVKNITAPTLPSDKAARQVIHRAKNAAENLPPLPSLVTEFDTPKTFTETQNGQKFIYYDKIIEQHRTIIFTTKSNI